MPDTLKKPDPTRVTAPQIPGVSQSPAKKPAAADEVEPEETPSAKPKLLYLGAVGSGTVVLILIVMIWWSRAMTRAARPSAAADAPAATAPAASEAASALPVAPGLVATTKELSHPWDAKKFLYRSTNGDSLPALVVRLPGNAYWAFLLRAPYSSCELEFVTDLEKLRNAYNFAAPHAMVGDPCKHTVYDLAQYGSGPNGLVRGEVVAGPGVRPPLAIEVEVKGDEILATRSEQQ